MESANTEVQEPGFKRKRLNDSQERTPTPYEKAVKRSTKAYHAVKFFIDSTLAEIENAHKAKLKKNIKRLEAGAGKELASALEEFNTTYKNFLDLNAMLKLVVEESKGSKAVVLGAEVSGTSDVADQQSREEEEEEEEKD